MALHSQDKITSLAGLLTMRRNQKITENQSATPNPAKWHKAGLQRITRYLARFAPVHIPIAYKLAIILTILIGAGMGLHR